MIILLVVFVLCCITFPSFLLSLVCAVKRPVSFIRFLYSDIKDYVVHKKYNECSFGRITCYIADGVQSFGCGKTLSAVDYLVSVYNRYNGVPVWCPERKCFVVQKIHIISNVDFLTIPFERLKSLSQFVKWTDEVKTIDYENGTLSVTFMLIDEASSQLNSREFRKNIDPYFLSRLLTSRHVRASILLTSQRVGMVDKLLRDVCDLYIGCNKIWRFQLLSYYDAYEINNAQTPSLVRPLRRSCWFVSDDSFQNYDTFSCVKELEKSCAAGDMLSPEEILALRVDSPTNMDAVERPSRRWLRRRNRR